MFDVISERLKFPILKNQVQEKSLVYLDNAASTQKPQAVLEVMHDFYSSRYSSVHRGIYELSEKATELFEGVRGKIQRFIQAQHLEEIVFTRGATESINLVAQSYLRPNLKPQDEILITQMEHHANIVPWQQLCHQTGACLKVIPLDVDGRLDLTKMDALLNEKTRLVAITHLSNVLGILNPIESVIQKAHQHNIPVLVDGAQAIGHMPLDIKALDCDFYVFSSHKMYGPSGVGILYGKKNHLESMPPWQTGGGMITRVSFDQTDYCAPPHRFEAGTPAIAEVIGLGATVDYLTSLDFKALLTYEQALYDYAVQSLRAIPTVTLLGQVGHNIGALSLKMEKIHPHDIATILNEEKVAIRAGHHCAMPLMEWLKVPATTRVSMGLYNTFKDIDIFVEGLRKVQRLLG